MTMKTSIIIFSMLLLFANMAYSQGGPAQEIYAKTTPQTYLAQKNELLIIHTIKYPNATFLLLVNDFEFLKIQGNAYAKGGNLTSHDAVLTTLQYLNYTLWDINDTQGTNISIYDNKTNDLNFKSLYVYENVLVFNLTELNVNYYKPFPVTSKWVVIILIIIWIGVVIYIFRESEKYGKKPNRM